MNPIITVASHGAEQTLRRGNVTFSLGSSERPLIVFAVRGAVSTPPPAQPTSAPAGGVTSSQSALVLDEVYLGRDLQVTSKWHVVEQLYKVRRVGRSVSFVPKRPSHEVIVCASGAKGISPLARHLAASRFQRPAAWVSYVPSSRLTRRLLSALAAAQSQSQSIAQARRDYAIALEQLRSTIPAKPETIQVASAAGPLSLAWKSDFSARSGSWDRCLPALGPSFVITEFRCSDGVRLSLVVPGAGRQRTLPTLRTISTIRDTVAGLFDSRSQKISRVRLVSMPLDAAIFVGPVRQSARTAARMDVPNDQVQEIRLEKSGYKPCPYSRFELRPRTEQRPVPEFFCNLEPIGQRRPAKRRK